MLASQANFTSKRSLAWVVWGIAAAFYFSDYLARVAPGVMHQSLQMAFGLNEAGFGLLTASFYVPYILMQIPVGLTVDKLSIRHVLTVMSLVTALGCVVFGMSEGLLSASIGRMLIGLSAAFAFISALRLATSWFPPMMLGLLAGLTQALGMLGAAAGEAPVSFLVAMIGWRCSSFVMAVLFVLLAALLFKLIRDNPSEKQWMAQFSEKSSLLESLKTVLSSKQTWMNAFYAGFLYVPTAVLGEAIGPAYLQYGRGLSQHAAAFAIGLVFIGWGIGGPLTGWISDKIGRRKIIMVISAIIGLILSLILVYAPTINVFGAYVLFFVFGLTNTGVAIAYAVSTELHNRRVVGTAIGFTNMASIFVGALMQPMVGYFIDRCAGIRAYHVESLLLRDFQVGLRWLPLCSLIALVLACMVKETYCRPQQTETHH